MPKHVFPIQCVLNENIFPLFFWTVTVFLAVTVDSDKDNCTGEMKAWNMQPAHNQSTDYTVCNRLRWKHSHT